MLSKEKRLDVLFEALGSHDLAVARVSGAPAIVCGQLPNSRHSTVPTRLARAVHPHLKHTPQSSACTAESASRANLRADSANEGHLTHSIATSTFAPSLPRLRNRNQQCFENTHHDD